MDGLCYNFCIYLYNLVYKLVNGTEEHLPKEKEEGKIAKYLLLIVLVGYK